MQTIYATLMTLFVSTFFCLTGASQIVINELDSDTPGIDTKEFVELRTTSPFFPLNGYVLVFFNGNPSASNANMSYYAISLNGLQSDSNGIVTLGNNAVSPVPDFVFPDNIIQNGEDAVAVYQAGIADFPNGTLATTTNLIHALAYDTSDPDALTLMSLLGIIPPQLQINENENNAQDTESIQRKNDGTYEVKLPTPGAMNDGSGITYNGLTILVNTAHRTEGDTVHITCKAQQIVSSPLSFTFSLLNNTFNSADYTGNLTVSIPAGMDTWSTVITLTDDIVDEGDEVLKISFGSLPFGYNRLNDNIQIRVVDNDFSTDPWGTPLQPTYGIVSSTAPVGYYNALHGLSGSALKQALQDIIADSLTVRAHCYGDITSILMQADRNPENNNQIWQMYVESPRAKLDFQTTGSGTGTWNREHIYPQSRGGFSNGTSDTADGITIYLPTNANDILAGHADAHHIHAEDANENSTRNNKDYGGTDYNGPSGSQHSWRGDVARALFYMAVRYNGLSVVSGNPPDNTLGQLGDLDSLLSWHQSDPRDDFEMNRNNYIYTWQQNRNPFIDLPELAAYIFGNKQTDVWLNTTSTNTYHSSKLTIYPNPAHHQIRIQGTKGKSQLSIYSAIGQLLMKYDFDDETTLPLSLAAGLYVLHIRNGETLTVHKLIVE